MPPPLCDRGQGHEGRPHGRYVQLPVGCARAVGKVMVKMAMKVYHYIRRTVSCAYATACRSKGSDVLSHGADIGASCVDGAHKARKKTGETGIKLIEHGVLAAGCAGVPCVVSSGLATALAPWWRRVVALCVDAIAIAVIANVLLLAAGFHPYWQGRHLATSDLLARYVTGLIAAVCYFPPIVRYTDGQTLGKLLLGIRVIRVDARPMSLARGLWREVVVKIAIIDLLAVIPTVGGVVGGIAFALDGSWPLWDPESRALHDMLAATLVIRTQNG